MPAEGFVNVSMRADAVDELRQAIEAGRLKHRSVRSVPHALEVGAQLLLAEATAPATGAVR